MSAYVVNDVTINRVISFLYMKAQGGEYWPTRWLTDQGYDMRNDEVCEQLATDMFALNVRAVDERYGQGEAAQFRPLDYAFRFAIAVNEAWAYKALRCWLYQCTEGTAPESDLYQLMDKLSRRIAANIVNHSAAYEAAPWG